MNKKEMPDFKTALHKLNDAGWEISKKELKEALFGEDKQKGVWKFYAVLVKYLLKQRIPQPYITETSGAKFTWLNKAYEAAQEFRVTMVLSPNEAFEEYVKCALQALGRQYTLNRLSLWQDRVFEYYRNKQYIQQHSMKRRKAFYTAYEVAVLDMSGYQTPKAKMDQKYMLNCAEAMRLVDECKADDVGWIEAQFETYRAVNAGPPAPAKLCDANAHIRYARYINQ